MLKKAERPVWLNKRIDLKKCREFDALFKELRLNTVCREAFCPNISECFGEGAATFLILGNRCTRGCRFCAVQKGIPRPIDPDEPRRVAKAVERLGLRHIVVTSVTRDDLPDGGAGAFVDTINAIRKAKGRVTIEVLVPDFSGDAKQVERLIDAKPEIFAHNIETVPRLYNEARDGADYGRSLSVLEAAKKFDKSINTKSGIMLGLGESKGEVLDVFCGLREAGCDFLSIGQYLSPSPRHLPVKEYIPPERFVFYKREAEKSGFLSIESGPYVRSSYLAGRYIGKG